MKTPISFTWGRQNEGFNISLARDFLSKVYITQPFTGILVPIMFYLNSFSIMLWACCVKGVMRFEQMAESLGRVYNIIIIMKGA